MADDGQESGRGIDRRTVLRTSALAAGLVWSRPIVRTAALQGATGTPEPATTTPTTAEPPPTMAVEAHSECRGLAPFALVYSARGFEPFTRFAASFSFTPPVGTGTNGTGFTTDGTGDSVIDYFGTIAADQPFTVYVVVWPDPNDNQTQDPGEPTVFSGVFVNDTACKSGDFVPD